MKHIIYEGKYIKIRIRDVVIWIILLLLFFFCMHGCEEHSLQAKKEDKIQDYCMIMKANANDLNELLKRSDLCSEAWFREYDAFTKRLIEQNALLEQEAETTQAHNAMNVKEKQREVITAMETFKTQPSIQQVEQLETKVKAYSRYYHEQCERGDER